MGDAGGLAHQVIPVDLSRKAHKTPKYLAINPAGQIPTIVDHGAPGGPRVLAQSGAIVLHACNKAGRHIPTDEATHYTAMRWCMQAATCPIHRDEGSFAVFKGLSRRILDLADLRKLTARMVVPSRPQPP